PRLPRARGRVRARHGRSRPPAGPRALPSARPGPAAADADAGPKPAAARPEPAPDLVEPVERTPTEAVDYAVLSAMYATALGATAISARRREQVPAAELPALAA